VVSREGVEALFQWPSGRESNMKHWLLSLTIVALAAAPPVYAKGCIKGAIVGGIAGSAVGHGKMGAAAGCAVGHHEANKADNTKGAPPPSSQPAK